MDHCYMDRTAKFDEMMIIIITPMCRKIVFTINMCIEKCSCKHNMIPLMAECLVEVLILECFLFLGPQIFNWGSFRDQCALECFKKWIIGHFPSCTSGTAFNLLQKKKNPHLLRLKTGLDMYIYLVPRGSMFSWKYTMQLWILHFVVCRITIGFMYQSQEPWRNLWKFLGACTRYRILYCMLSCVWKGICLCCLLLPFLSNWLTLASFHLIGQSHCCE